MSTSTQGYAYLSADAYIDPNQRGKDETVEADGVEYRVIEHVDKRSGYQGTIYQCIDTGELVVAHRGTEFDRELARDGILADGGMVLLGRNSQADDAIALTQRALELAKELGPEGQPLNVTTTGHSLGGTLAQITAHRFGLKGETFDAYGAAGLVSDIPAGGHQMINHVRATDFVSAASRQFGETRIYAPQQDIDALHAKGYANDGRRLTDLRNPLGVALGIGIEAHYSRNFLPGNDLLGESVISDANRARYEQYQPMVDKYRHDIALIHGTLALPRNTVDAVIDAARDVVHHRPPAVAPTVAPTLASTLTPISAGMRAPFDPTQPQHPDHPMLQQIRSHVHALDARLGRVPDEASERVSASLLVAAREAGLTRVDSVLLSIQTPEAQAGARMFAVQETRPVLQRAQIDTQAAVGTPVAQSFQQLETLNQRQLQQQAVQASLDQQLPPQTAQGMAR